MKKRRTRRKDGGRGASAHGGLGVIGLFIKGRRVSARTTATSKLRDLRFLDVHLDQRAFQDDQAACKFTSVISSERNKLSVYEVLFLFRLLLGFFLLRRLSGVELGENLL